MKIRNIAVVWDFDKTLTPHDSTSKVIEHFNGSGRDKDFWALVKELGQRGYTGKKDWEHILASDAPAWMYSLSKIAQKDKVPLNKDFFQKLVGKVPLFPNAEVFLKNIKSLEDQPEFKKLNVSIHHFIISAGLKEFVELLVPKEIFTWIWGCRYAITIEEADIKGDSPESVPVFCMDETMKTRALFEVVKGTFKDTEKRQVNHRIEDSELWCTFQNLIYIGDGPTDIPALSLVRDRGGMGIVVYDKDKKDSEVIERLGRMSADKRCDLITPADFSIGGELHTAIQNKCIQIRQKFAAEDLKL